ncbi:hypothetical protein F8M41_009473 [Gigaspora margarita]|uniref:Uncharacterized protein n=1 Tax=Gigaspora margarita TaxID=4874 RepID=A0A8H3X4W9_GIGMA|nr:hypothetical protein F8M41_009473 [Gigaspora margarita]
MNYYNNVTNNYCYEQRLLLRVIKADGSVIQINYENVTEIQDINYCSVTSLAKYPLNFYPLFDQYILVTYTHATNTSDTSTYVGRFLRLSTINGIGTNPEFFKWSQYGYNDNGSFSLLAEDIVSSIQHLTSFQVTVFATLDGGYALTHTSQIQNGTSTVITITITPIAAAPTVVPITTTVTTPPTTVTSSENFYLKIRFLSTGSVLALDPILAQNNGSLTIVRTLPYGGYALIDRIISGFNINFAFELYDEFNALTNYNFPIRPLITDFNGVFDILPNNTMLVALSETTATSWQILSVQLPSLSPYNDNVYGNLHVSATYSPKGSKNLTLNSNSINITYHDPIKLNKGNLYIYQSTINGSKTLRQLINTKSCNLDNGCNVSGKVVTLKVLDCTFNDPNAQYYIEVDNDFIKSSIYNEPILGIDPNMWTFNTGGGIIQGELRLTNDGTQYFQNLNDIERERFFNHLINELTILIPTENGRLSSNGHYQKDTSDSSKIIIMFSISEAKSSDNQRISTEIESNLNLLIKNKDLRAYQQVLPHSIWMKLMDTNDISENFCILTLGLTIFCFVTYIVFTFTDAKLIPNIFIPSVAFLVNPIIVLNSSVLFDVVPIFAAVASGISVLASITSKLFFIRHKAYSPYLSHFVEKRKTIIMDEKVEKQTYDANEVVDTIDRK